MKDIMIVISGFFKKRYNKKQKDNFVKYIKRQFENIGYEFSPVVSKNKIGQKITNIIFGDISEARIVYVTAYDTPSKMLIPNYEYYPFNRITEDKNNKNNGKIGLVLSVILLIAYFLFIYPLFKLELKIALKIALILITTIFLLLINVLMAGIANKYNFTRNTAAISLMYEIAKKDKSSCYIFLDEFSTSNVGLKELSKQVSIKDKEVIFFDCVGSKCEYALAQHGNSKELDAIKKKLLKNGFEELSLQNGFESINEQIDSYIVISSGAIQNNQLIVKGTRTKKDQAIDFKSLEKLVDLL